MRRQPELDLLRGFLILLMAFNHTPNPFRDYTDQPLGFVSAAEGFVFLSAFLVGSISKAKIGERGLPWLREFAFKKALSLYAVHVAMLVFLFLTAGVLFHGLPGFGNFILRFFDTPLSAAISALLLLYQPPLFDILPMYILFLAVTPMVFRASRVLGWGGTLAISGLGWLLGLAGGTQYFLGTLAGLSALVVEPGSFDPLCWQFIWISGLALAQAKPPTGHAAPLAILAGATVLFFFCWRNPNIPFSIDLGDSVWLLDKWRLGPLRLLNFFALVVVLRRYGPRLRQIPAWFRPLSFLGRNALPVFSLHVCFSVLAVGAIETYRLGDYACIAILCLHMALLFGYAGFREGAAA